MPENAALKPLEQEAKYAGISDWLLGGAIVGVGSIALSRIALCVEGVSHSSNHVENITFQASIGSVLGAAALGVGYYFTSAYKDRVAKPLETGWQEIIGSDEALSLDVRADEENRELIEKLKQGSESKS